MPERRMVRVPKKSRERRNSPTTFLFFLHIYIYININININIDINVNINTIIQISILISFSFLISTMHLATLRVGLQKAIAMASCLGECGIHCHSRFDSGCLQCALHSLRSMPSSILLISHSFGAKHHAIFQQNPIVVTAQLDAPMDSGAVLAQA